jgi:hypothetical protein
MIGTVIGLIVLLIVLYVMLAILGTAVTLPAWLHVHG